MLILGKLLSKDILRLHKTSRATLPKLRHLALGNVPLGPETGDLLVEHLHLDGLQSLSLVHCSGYAEFLDSWAKSTWEVRLEALELVVFDDLLFSSSPENRFLKRHISKVRRFRESFSALKTLQVGFPIQWDQALPSTFNITAVLDTHGT
jgi:hypothetical protein